MVCFLSVTPGSYVSRGTPIWWDICLSHHRVEPQAGSLVKVGPSFHQVCRESDSYVILIPHIARNQVKTQQIFPHKFILALVKLVK